MQVHTVEDQDHLHKLGWMLMKVPVHIDHCNNSIYWACSYGYIGVMRIVYIGTYVASVNM